MESKFTKIRSYLNKHYYYYSSIRWLFMECRDGSKATTLDINTITSQEEVDREFKNTSCHWCGNIANGQVRYPSNFGSFNFPVCKKHISEYFPGRADSVPCIITSTRKKKFSKHDNNTFTQWLRHLKPKEFITQ